MITQQELIESLEIQGILKNPALKEVMQEIPREAFVRVGDKKWAYLDNALSIGYEQTISQPTTVIFMLELLDIHPGQKILEIGYGSGWQTAMLVKLVGDKGQVYAFEIIPELAEFGKKNLERFGFKNLELYNCDYNKKLKKIEFVDRIISGAAFEEIPENLKAVLRIGGKLVVPTHNHDIRLLIRKNKNNFQEKIFPGFVFVPITHDNVE